MARLVLLGKSSHDELTALESLAQMLPADYTLTTKLRDVDRRELDSVLLSPFGIVCLELKHWFGKVTPKHVGSWDREQGEPSDNPFEQAEVAAKRLAGYLKRRIRDRRVPFVDYLIVLTNPECILNIEEESISDEDGNHVARMEDVPRILESLLRPRRVLSREGILKIVKLLEKPRATIDSLVEAAESSTRPLADAVDPARAVGSPTARLEPALERVGSEAELSDVAVTSQVRRAPVEGVEVSGTPETVLGVSEGPTADELATVERAVREFGESWASKAALGQLQEVLERIPGVPRDTRMELVSVVSAAVGRPLKGPSDPLDWPMRVAFWRVLKDIRRTSQEANEPASSAVSTSADATTEGPRPGVRSHVPGGETAPKDQDLSTGKPALYRRRDITPRERLEAERERVTAAIEDIEDEIDVLESRLGYWDLANETGSDAEAARIERRLREEIEGLMEEREMWEEQLEGINERLQELQ